MPVLPPLSAIQQNSSAFFPRAFHIASLSDSSKERTWTTPHLCTRFACICGNTITSCCAEVRHRNNLVTIFLGNLCKVIGHRIQKVALFGQQTPRLCQTLPPSRVVGPQLKSAFPAKLLTAASVSRALNSFLFVDFVCISLDIGQGIPETRASRADHRRITLFIARTIDKGVPGCFPVHTALFSAALDEIMSHPSSFATSSFLCICVPCCIS